MKNASLTILLCLTIGFAGCKYFGTLSGPGPTFNGQISIDTSYILYTRTLCRPQPLDKHYYGPRLYHRPAASSERTNCLGSTVAREVLEREYMLISKARRRAIYISPYPPYTEKDWWQLYDRAVFNDPTFVNLWYANRFHFGSLSDDGTLLSFQHSSDPRFTTWQVTWNGTNDALLSINEVTVHNKKRSTIYITGSTLSSGLQFERQITFNLGFQAALDYSFSPPDTASFRLRGNVIFLDDKDLYFPLEGGALDVNGRNIQWVIFHGKRISTTPQYIKD